QSLSTRTEPPFRTSHDLDGLQVALSLFLLAGVGLFVHTLHNLKNLNPGFNSEKVLFLKMNPSLSRRVEATPPSMATNPRRKKTWILSSRMWNPSSSRLRESPFFLGRHFGSLDNEASPIIIISERVACQFFGNQKPIGKRLESISSGQKWIAL